MHCPWLGLLHHDSAKVTVPLLITILGDPGRRTPGPRSRPPPGNPRPRPPCTRAKGVDWTVMNACVVLLQAWAPIIGPHCQCETHIYTRIT